MQDEEAERRLAGRTVLVTGGSRGLGAALARRFAEEGAAVSLCSRDEEALRATRADVLERAPEARVVLAAADVSRSEDVERWIGRSVEELGAPDALVNNASLLGPLEPVEGYDVEAWRRVLEVNLTGAFLCARAAVAHLRRTRGSLVNVSSGVGRGGRPSWGAYCVSKNGLEALSEMMAGELEGDGVRVNVVDPGAMRTSMRAAAYPDEDPATLPTPYEVTDVFVYLASEASAGVTGHRFRAQEFDVAYR